MRQRRLRPFMRPDPPNKVAKDPEALKKWSSYWDQVERDWEYEMDEEKRRQHKESRNK